MEKRCTRCNSQSHTDTPVGSTEYCQTCLGRVMHEYSKEIEALQEKLFSKQEELRKLQISALG